MPVDNHKICLSLIDEQRFGVRTAKATKITADELPGIIDFCRSNDVALLIARCGTSELETAQAMERNGFQLMDSLLYYQREIEKLPIPADTGIALIRPLRTGEEQELQEIAAETFRGYFGHYHADVRLENKKCDEVYSNWAFRSAVSRDQQNGVIIADFDASIVGFATLKLNSPDEGDCLLIGVAPSARKRGINRSLLIGCMEWCHSKGAERFIISTQITNVIAQKNLVRLGLELRESYYTFHKWFNDRA